MNIKTLVVSNAVVLALFAAGCKNPALYQKQEEQAPEAEVAPAPAEEAVSAEEAAPVSEATPAPAPASAAEPEPAPAPAAEPAPAPAPETTDYVVRSGDMLSKIATRYHLKQKAILDVNPGLKADRLAVGQKIKLPGKIDVKAAPAPAAAKPAKPAAAKKPVAKAKKPALPSVYEGPTAEYKIQNGDYLGKIAEKYGISVAALKNLNGLKDNNIRAGRTLKVPAAKVEAAAAPAPETAPAAPAPAASAPEAAPAEAPVADDVVVEEATTVVEEVVPEAPAQARTYVTVEGDDLVSIATKCGVTPSVLMDLNNLTYDDKLQAGVTLKIPAAAEAPAAE